MSPTRKNARPNAFTLLEIMMGLGIFIMVIAGTLTVYLTCQRVWYSTSLYMEASREASMGLSRMVYGVGTNGGLREAASVTLDNNRIGSWSGTTYPPPAGSDSHYIQATASAYKDGSWLLTVSNYAGRIMGYTYNSKASNICFAPVIGLLPARLEVANYVTAASVTPTNKGVIVSIAVTRKFGVNTSSVTNSTFVKLRN